VGFVCRVKRTVENWNFDQHAMQHSHANAETGGGGNKEQRAESKSQINLGSKVNSSQQSTTDKNRRKSIINPTIFRTSAINIKR
jgi:hypothetical protein